MALEKPAAPRRVGMLLVAGWGFSAVVFVAAYFLAGFYGWAAIFIWSMLAAPLGLFTHRYLAMRGRPLATECRTLALRAWGLLAVGSVVAGVGPWLLAPYQSRILAAVMVAIVWSVFVGQIALVAFTTGWTAKHLLARRPVVQP